MLLFWGCCLKGQRVQMQYIKHQLFTSDEVGLPSVMFSTSSCVSYGGWILFLSALTLRSSRNSWAVTAGPPTRNTPSESSSPPRVATMAFDEGGEAGGISISLYNSLQIQIWSTGWSTDEHDALPYQDQLSFPKCRLPSLRTETSTEMRNHSDDNHICSKWNWFGHDTNQVFENTDINNWK